MVRLSSAPGMPVQQNKHIRKRPSRLSRSRRSWDADLDIDEEADHFHFLNEPDNREEEGTKDGVEEKKEKTDKRQLPSGRKNSINNPCMQSFHRQLKARLETAENMKMWLKSWDSGSKRVRRRMLEVFLRENGNSSLEQLQYKFSDGLSLVLSRFTSSLRLTYLIGFSLSLQIECIALLLSLMEEKAYMREFLQSGTVLTLMELVTMTHEAQVADMDKIKALELLLTIARVGPTPKGIIGDYHGLDAIAECMSNTNNDELHLHATNFLVELATDNPALATSSVGHLATLLRSTHRYTKISACRAMRRLLTDRKSCFFVTPQAANTASTLRPLSGSDLGGYTSQSSFGPKSSVNQKDGQPQSWEISQKAICDRLLAFIVPAVNLVLEDDGLMQQHGSGLVRDLLKQQGLFVPVIKQLLLVFNTASKKRHIGSSGNGGSSTDSSGVESEDSMLKHGTKAASGTTNTFEDTPAKLPAWFILSLFDELVTGGTESVHSTMCHAGVLNAVIGSMLNIHSYEVQKLATKLCRNLSTRFSPARADLESILGPDITARIIKGSEIEDGQVVREFIQDEELHFRVADLLQQRKWTTSFRGGSGSAPTQAKSPSSQTKHDPNLGPQNNGNNEGSSINAQTNTISADRDASTAAENANAASSSCKGNSIFAIKEEEGEESEKNVGDEEGESRELNESHDSSQSSNSELESDNVESDDYSTGSDASYSTDEEHSVDGAGEAPNDGPGIWGVDAVAANLVGEQGTSVEDTMKTFVSRMDDMQERQQKQIQESGLESGNNISLSISMSAERRQARVKFPLSQEQMDMRLKRKWAKAAGERMAEDETFAKSGEPSGLTTKKEELYVPCIKPKKLDAAVTYTQFICQEKATTRDEDQETLEYIKGLPAPEEPDFTHQGTSAEAALEQASANIIQDVPLNHLPDQVAASYSDKSSAMRSTKTKKDSSLESAEGDCSEPGQKKNPRTLVSLEEKVKLRAKKAEEIRKNKAELKRLRELAKGEDEEAKKLLTKRLFDAKQGASSTSLTGGTGAAENGVPSSEKGYSYSKIINFAIQKQQSLPNGTEQADGTSAPRLMKRLWTDPKRAARQALLKEQRKKEDAARKEEEEQKRLLEMLRSLPTDENDEASFKGKNSARSGQGSGLNPSPPTTSRRGSISGRRGSAGGTGTFRRRRRSSASGKGSNESNKGSSTKSFKSKSTTESFKAK